MSPDIICHKLKTANDKLQHADREFCEKPVKSGIKYHKRLVLFFCSQLDFPTK